MTKKIYFLLLFVLACWFELEAQIVHIPDVNFKNRLILMGVDTNADGEIQISEAQNTTNLSIGSSNISSLIGLEAFINLAQLSCKINNITNLDLSPFPNLQYLDCANNQLSSLDASGFTNLTFLDCSDNQLTSLSVNSLTSISYLDCNQNLLTSLDVTNLTSLNSLYCANNQITTLDVSSLISLTHLTCGGNPITILDVSNLTNLQTLNCCFSELVSLDVSGLNNLTNLFCRDNFLTNLTLSPNIVGLQCQNNQLTSINLSNLANLNYLLCNNNQLTSLVFNSQTNLGQLNCRNNQLQSVMLNNFTNLFSLDCNANMLQSIDVTNSPDLQELSCDSNQLSTLFIKNGINENTLSFKSNPNLLYVCADSIQFIDIQQKLSLWGMSNVSVNSYCSNITGTYNTVSGKSTYDADLNGCTFLDTSITFLMLSVSNSIDTGYVCTNMTGNYTAFLDSGTYIFTPQFENPAYFTVNPLSSNIYFPNNNNNVQIQDFCVTPNGIFPDVEIVIISSNMAAVPGFDSDYQLFFHNKGTTTVSGDITVDFMGNKIVFVSSSQATSAQTANQLTWAYSNLQPFETRSISFTMNLLPPPINNGWDTLSFTASIPLVNDVANADNYLNLIQQVLNPFDPNNKTCLEGNLLNNDKIGDYLHYMIRFQNTGNYYADHVLIVDSINTNQFDVASIQVLETSHNAYTSIENNVLNFYFGNIMLADSFSNEPESHGYVLYKIKTKSNLPINSSVSNKAEIYFDYNLPVVTNTEITTFANTVGIASSLQSLPFTFYPNPAQNMLNIETSESLELVLYNSLGEKMLSKRVQGKESIDVSALAKGLYWIVGQGSGLAFVKE